MKTRRAELALAGITALWGVSFVVVKAAIGEISPILFIALRFALAALVLTRLYGRKVRREGLFGGILAGCLLFGAFVTQTMGLEWTSASKSAFLTALSVPMVPFIGAIVYRSRPRPVEIAGILVATAGTILLTLPGAGEATGFGVLNRGDVLSFLCAVFFALHMVVTGHYAPTSGFETLAVLQAGVTAALALLLFPLAGPVRFHLSAGSVAAVLVMGLFSTALAFTTMAWAQQYTSATRTALILTLEPVVAAIAGRIFNGDRLSGRAEAGAGVIFAGIVLGEMARGLKRRG